MADLDLQNIYDLLISIAHEAGRMIMGATPSQLSSGTKKNSADLVTETDQAVEKMVSTRLMSAYPKFSFIGEETYVPGSTRLTSAPTFIANGRANDTRLLKQLPSFGAPLDLRFYSADSTDTVDPIDGTTNFVHAFPAFCISLGFVVDKVPTVGVIFNPFLDETYTAIKGNGAFVTRHGGQKIRLPLKQEPEPLKDLSTCLVGAEWGSDRTGINFELKSKVFTKLAASKESGGAMVHSLRCMGSAALNLAAVATGQQDIFWEGGCWAWDVAAGWCILTEAGGIMASGNPGDWKPEIDGRKYLAVRAAPSGQRKVVEEFWKIIGDGRLEYES